jgi:hypothetical protein
VGANLGSYRLRLSLRVREILQAQRRHNRRPVGEFFELPDLTLICTTLQRNYAAWLARRLSTMHRALSIQEIVTLIVNMTHEITYYRHGTLAALACVNHMFSEAALDLLWTQPPIWALMECMPSDSYCIKSRNFKDISGFRVRNYTTIECVRPILSRHDASDAVDANYRPLDLPSRL